MTWSTPRFCLLLLLSLSLAAVGQPPIFSTERPGGADSDPLESPRDLSGRSVKTCRVRAIHATELPGSSGWLMKNDPWLAYQRGRELSLREFSQYDGAFGEQGKLRGKTQDDGATVIGSSDHVNSCAACHNVPWRDMGAGITIQKNSGAGRNTPHLFGAGLVEMVGEEIRRQLLAEVDANHDGHVDLSEAHGRARVESTPGQLLDYGSFADEDGDGHPDLNPIVYVWYLDKDGHRIPWARDLNAPGVAGYNFEVQVFGFGQRDKIGHGALGSTLRAVGSNALDVHTGLQAHDPTANLEPGRDGLCGVSLAGARQFYTGFTRDEGTVLGAGGMSLDDPDRDGVCEEISEGDLDLLEFFLLNHPAPTQQSGPRFARGRAVFASAGCVECHTPDWKLPEDRRFFKLDVEQGQGHVRPAGGGPFLVQGIFSDFRHHDMGPDFCEMQYDGSKVKAFRTTPLWGVGTTAPYGHDGASLSLDQVIRRHGGEGLAARQAYEKLEESQREDLLAFLGGLVLYSTETLPTDVDGDGVVSDHFVVAGVDTGRETFNPEWLFRIPGQIEGWVDIKGEPVLSKALVNVNDAYGVNLTGLRDLDRNGFPDWLERRPVAQKNEEEPR